jgi:hypothetical protein
LNQWHGSCGSPCRRLHCSSCSAWLIRHRYAGTRTSTSALYRYMPPVPAIVRSIGRGGFFIACNAEIQRRLQSTYRTEPLFYTHFDLASGHSFSTCRHDLFRHEIWIGQVPRLRSALPLDPSLRSMTFPLVVLHRGFTKPSAMIPADDCLDAHHAETDTALDGEFLTLSDYREKSCVYVTGVGFA